MKKFLGVSTLLVLPIIVTLIMGAIGLPMKGLGFLRPNDSERQNEVTRSIAYANFSKTPAYEVMTRFFNDLDSKWKSNSVLSHSAGLPYPFNCVQPAATLTGSKGYDGSVDSQVTYAAYPAGIGAVAFDNLVNKVNNCKANRTSVWLEKKKLGAEAYSADVSWGRNHTEVTFWRRGDIITFVATDTKANSTKLARKVDDFLLSAMGDACLDKESLVRDAKRNAFFSGDKFKGLSRIEKLTTPKVDKPTLTEDQSASGVKVTAIPAVDKKVKKVDIETAETLVQPDPRLNLPESSYSLWPKLPEEAAFPRMPDVPTPQKLESVATLRIDDISGPGCGWNFLSTVKPDFDEELVEQANSRLVHDEQSLLDSDGLRWRSDVLTYWILYAEYLKDIPEYEKYRAKVEIIFKEWGKIHKRWKEYYKEYEKWYDLDQARLKFIEDQKTARSLYESRRLACVDLPNRITAWQEDYNHWQNVLIPQWNVDVAQYEADYPRLYSQYQARVKNWREVLIPQYEEKYTIWVIEHRRWVDGGKIGIEPPEPKRPKKPSPPKAPVKPVAPVKPSLSHPCPPPVDPIITKAPPLKEAPPTPPADLRP